MSIDHSVATAPTHLPRGELDIDEDIFTSLDHAQLVGRQHYTTHGRLLRAHDDDFGGIETCLDIRGTNQTKDISHRRGYYCKPDRGRLNCHGESTALLLLTTP